MLGHHIFQPAGCDRVLNSKKKVDKCGVCDGDNSSCRRFTGTFNKTRFGKVCTHVIRRPSFALRVQTTTSSWLYEWEAKRKAPCYARIKRETKNLYVTQILASDAYLDPSFLHLLLSSLFFAVQSTSQCLKELLLHSFCFGRVICKVSCCFKTRWCVTDSLKISDVN